MNVYLQESPIFFFLKGNDNKFRSTCLYMSNLNFSQACLLFGIFCEVSQKAPWVLFFIIFLMAECVDHFYDDSCSSPCGNCLNEKACDKQNGACSNGCKAHFKGPTCDGK